MPTKTMKKPPAVPADKTPDCPPHLWHVFQDGSAYCKKCPETRPAGSFVLWSGLLDAPSMNYSVHRGILPSGQAHYRPVEIFRI